ncbi:MAG: hypothetical protein M1838_003631 [Thelocarpon superellum]|nr:MAG: hypothetical protein M1838_003631 [Thelocarpon superellum]
MDVSSVVGSGSTAALDDQLLHLHDSRQATLLAALIFVTVLSSVAVGLRLLARRIAHVGLSYDDWTILVAQVFAYGSLAACVTAMHYGLGLHTLAINIANIEKLEQLHYAINLLYSFGLLPTKIAILLFYRRIFPTPGFLRMCNLYLVFWTIVWTSNFLPVLLICRPVSYYWDKSGSGSCFDEYRFLMASGAITIFTDILLLVMPIRMVWRLQISNKQRSALCCIFLLGGFVCVASTLRLPYLYLLFTDDPTWDSYEPTVWTEVELNLGIVCACLPTLRPVARKIGGFSILSTFFSTGTGDSGRTPPRPSFVRSWDGSNKPSWLSHRSTTLASATYGNLDHNDKGAFQHIDPSASHTPFSKDAPAMDTGVATSRSQDASYPSKEALLHSPTSTVMSSPSSQKTPSKSDSPHDPPSSNGEVVISISPPRSQPSLHARPASRSRPPSHTGQTPLTAHPGRISLPLSQHPPTPPPPVRTATSPAAAAPTTTTTITDLTAAPPAQTPTPQRSPLRTPLAPRNELDVEAVTSVGRPVTFGPPRSVGGRTMGKSRALRLQDVGSLVGEDDDDFRTDDDFDDPWNRIDIHSGIAGAGLGEGKY